MSAGEDRFQVPKGGTTPAALYFAVSPTRFVDSASASGGSIRVHLKDPVSGSDIPGSPATIDIEMIPKHTDIRRICWVPGNEDASRLSDDTGKDGLGIVCKYLSQPPRLYANDIQTDPPVGLAAAAIVIVNISALVEGTVTRTAVLEYAAQGGAVLLIGSSKAGFTPYTALQPFEPAGLRFDLSKAVSGRFVAPSAGPLSGAWRDLIVTDGCALFCEPATGIVVPVPGGNNQAAFAAVSYGAGRIAALAGATPLENQAMRAGAALPFADALFAWLADAGKNIRDMDQDRLPDDLEDRPPLGILNPGETNYLDPDTDNDGIPDGVEDSNLNGQVDPNETSPLNPDSDGDGVLDGADTWPLPEAGAPQIIYIDRAETPAEGGVPVAVVGRNFGPDTSVWMGGVPVPRTLYQSPSRLEVETPWFAEQPESPVSVRVENESTGLYGVLPEALRVRPPATVRLALASKATVADAVTAQPRITLSVDSPAGTPVHQMRIYLRAFPPGAITWQAPRLHAALIGSSQLTVQYGPAGWLRLDIFSARGIDGDVPVAYLPFTLNAQERSDEIRIATENSWCANVRSVAYGVTEAETRLRFDEAINPGETGH